MATRDGLTGAHIAFMYTTKFKEDVLGKTRIPTPIWKDAKEIVDNPSTRQSLLEYINKRIVEEKRQPASPASSRGKKGKGVVGGVRAKAKPKLKTIKEGKNEEDEEELRTVIKPAKQHLSWLDLNNDPYLINKVR